MVTFNRRYLTAGINVIVADRYPISVTKYSFLTVDPLFWLENSLTFQFSVDKFIRKGDILRQGTKCGTVLRKSALIRKFFGYVNAQMENELYFCLLNVKFGTSVFRRPI